MEMFLVTGDSDTYLGVSPASQVCVSFRFKQRRKCSQDERFWCIREKTVSGHRLVTLVTEATDVMFVSRILMPSLSFVSDANQT
jgi:hypothetical protein